MANHPTAQRRSAIRRWAGLIRALLTMTMPATTLPVIALVTPITVDDTDDQSAEPGTSTSRARAPPNPAPVAVTRRRPRTATHRQRKEPHLLAQPRIDLRRVTARHDEKRWKHMTKPSRSDTVTANPDREFRLATPGNFAERHH